MSLCECGCGNLAPIATRNVRALGIEKGQPLRFIKGHNAYFRKGIPCPRKKPQYIVVPNGCWEWQLTVSANGYGQVRINKTTVTAHRWLYQKIKGVVLEEEIDLDHLCRNRRCVNPDHLEPVSHVDNVRRGNAATITMEVARAVREERAKTGASYKSIGSMFGLKVSHVHHIVTNRLWKEVEDVA